ncbi:MAG: PD-(D/E)XK nuclease family protein, partial [Actinomycetota bacterium]|nr:PD-(D/E)XK nuclease family protein [Actinomycetota bacterium]
DRDLDAVVALFEAVGRAGEQRSRPGVGPLLDELEAQRIPGDTLAERSLRGDAVRLLTAHRSKGLEWDLVVVTGVQEGVWPDLRQRGSLLQSDRITGSGAREPTTAAELLVEERRLFYVAVTRARERLVVTSVASAEDDGERPSRFLDELGTSAEQVRERVRRPLATVSLVAALRSATVDPDSSPALQRAAALRLARLAAGGTDAPAVAAAHPRSWWGLNDPTHAEAPMTLPGERVRLSGTSVSDLSECPLRWFLSHEVHATKAATAAMGFGGVLHALADEVARGRTPADLDEVMRRLDRVWAHLAYEAPWLSHQQHEAAREALGRFLVWHSSPRDRTVVGTEVAFTLPLDLPGGPVLLRGFMDRVEIDHDGRVHVVDLKTGKKAPPEPSIAHHPQLATYQLAVRSGALDERLAEAGRPAGPPALGGAELVQLRVGKGAGPKVQPQPPLVADEDGSTWIETMLDDAVRRVLAEDFPASPGLQRCERCDFRRSCPAQPEGRQVVE